MIRTHHNKTVLTVSGSYANDIGNEFDIEIIIVVDKSHALVAEKALEYALNVWLHHGDSDEHCEDLLTQIEHAFTDNKVFTIDMIIKCA